MRETLENHVNVRRSRMCSAGMGNLWSPSIPFEGRGKTLILICSWNRRTRTASTPVKPKLFWHLFDLFFAPSARKLGTMCVKVTSQHIQPSILGFPPHSVLGPPPWSVRFWPCIDSNIVAADLILTNGKRKQIIKMPKHHKWQEETNYQNAIQPKYHT